MKSNTETEQLDLELDKWFKELEVKGKSKVVVQLEKTKKDRLSQETTHIYPRGYDIWKRIELRRPTGYLSFPLVPRIQGSEHDSNVGELANGLLQKAIELCRIKKRGKITLTTIRHTALRLTLEEGPSMNESQIKLLADNANTGWESLKKHYWKYEQSNEFINDLSEAMPQHEWACIKRVSLD